MSIRVELGERDSVDRALRLLRRLCRNAGIRQGRKARIFFEKPGDKRRRQQRERMNTLRKAERERSPFST